MEAELKAKWVRALRSGEFEQARGGLFDGKKLCCLGVLWHVCGRPEQLNDLWDTTVGDAKPTLIEMNDDQLKSFPEIADYIETTLPTLTSHDSQQGK